MASLPGTGKKSYSWLDSTVMVPFSFVLFLWMSFSGPACLPAGGMRLPHCVCWAVPAHLVQANILTIAFLSLSTWKEDYSQAAVTPECLHQTPVDRRRKGRSLYGQFLEGKEIQKSKHAAFPSKSCSLGLLPYREDADT